MHPRPKTISSPASDGAVGGRAAHADSVEPFLTTAAVAERTPPSSLLITHKFLGGGAGGGSLAPDARGATLLTSERGPGGTDDRCFKGLDRR